MWMGSQPYQAGSLAAQNTPACSSEMIVGGTRAPEAVDYGGRGGLTQTHCASATELPNREPHEHEHEPGHGDQTGDLGLPAQLLSHD
jgi:hypothetical protein